MNTKRGFTLIELLVVVAIIGLLSSVVLASLSGARIKARDVRRKADIRQLQQALGLYYSNHNDYTTASYGGACGTALNGSDVVSTGLIADGIMASIPTPPSNSGSCGDYYYVGTWASGGINGQNIAILTRLERTDTNCRTWVDSGNWYLTGSYCNGLYIVTI